MREDEYVVVASGTENVTPGAHGDLVLACDDLNAREAAVVEWPTGGGI
ncbi:MAG: hypothetical protein WB808_01095 [Candidatus Dormiibacterota bacterium]